MKLYTIKRTAAVFAAIFTLTLPISGCSIVKESINGKLNSAKNEIVSALDEARDEVSSALSEAKEEVSSAFSEAQGEVSEALDDADGGIFSAFDDIRGEVAEAIDSAQEDILGVAPETTKPAETTVDESTDTTTAPKNEATWYTFRTQKLFDDHYQKHGAEFGDITQDEYLQLANELIADESENVLHKREKEDDDYLYFNTTNNYFLVLSTDGYIRTFFIPSAGIKYWERQ